MQAFYRVGRVWSTVQRLLAELDLVNLRYPVSYTASEDSVSAVATLVMPRTKSKILVTFEVPLEGVAMWPASLYGPGKAKERITATVSQVYGREK